MQIHRWPMKGEISAVKKVSGEDSLKSHRVARHMHRMFAGKMDYLDSLERRKMMPPEELLKLASIQPHNTIVDLGAGPGYFSLPAAKMTTGKVIAMDVDPKMLETVQERAQEHGVKNLTAMTGMIEAIPLEGNTADVVIASLVLHEVKSLSKGLPEINRILKKDGRFLCVELEPKQRPMGTPRIASENLERALNEAGFTVIKRLYPVEFIYAFVAVKSSIS